MNAKTPRPPSPYEFWLLAKASLDAADAAYMDCQRRDREFNEGTSRDGSTFMSITVAFLYLRSVELALKAAIAQRRLAAAAEIRGKKLGHNIQNLIVRATTGGSTGGGPFSDGELGIAPDARKFLCRHSDNYANKWFEYHFEPSDLPDLRKCQGVATAIIQAVEPIAKTTPLTPSVG